MRLLSFIGLAFFLVACSPAARLPEPLGLAYLARSPLSLNVARVEVVKKYQSSSKPPHVENDFPVPPVAMIQQWTQDRLLPIGKTGYAVVTIEEASVIETSLKKTRGVQSFFTVDQSERYDADLSVRIEIFDDLGNSKGFSYARAKGARTVAENLSLGGRRKVWIHMMESLMNTLDEELERNVRANLGSYLQ